MDLKRFLPPFNKPRQSSFRDIANDLPLYQDPLDFLSSVRNIAAPRDARTRVHGAMHSALGEVERAITLRFEELNTPHDTFGRALVGDADAEIRNEFARARTFVEARGEELLRQVTAKLENLFIQRLVYSPDQDPFGRGWENFTRSLLAKELGEPPEHSYEDFDTEDDGEVRRRLQRWHDQADDWLETLCQRRVNDVMRGLEAEVDKFKTTWTDVTSELRRRAGSGGGLSQQVSDPELWSFDSDDPTVKNLLSGTQAQEVASRIVNRFAPSGQDLSEIGDMVRLSLEGRPIYGTDSVGANELEEHLSQAIAQKMRSALPIDTGFLSLVSNGTRFNEQLGELLAEMYRGAAAMEQTLWRVGEGRVGHVDSTSGVGITASQVHDNVLRGLGGGRNFAAVEGHPGDTHRLSVQMSTVGAPPTDLAIFREMIRAWYDWHFDQDRGHYDTEREWLENVKSELWKLYPDMGVSKGVTKGIMELIDSDLRAMYAGRDLIGTGSNGDLADQHLIGELLRELGVSSGGNNGDLQ
ncbi:MAG: hypothetical protein BZY88_02490 [SAR202 cluster bacterium Io17-Chloro-G9]|nr:MAG: hypothetical protein BZY88_02490 [SAR202 cluster bacterium Io17-Chloro-G9]